MPVRTDQLAEIVRKSVESEVEDVMEVIKKHIERATTISKLRLDVTEEINRTFPPEVREEARTIADAITFAMLLDEFSNESIPEPEEDFALYFFLSPFKTGEREENGKVIISIDYDKIRELYGFTREEIKEAVNSGFKAENNFSRHIRALLKVIEEIRTTI